VHREQSSRYFSNKLKLLRVCWTSVKNWEKIHTHTHTHIYILHYWKLVFNISMKKQSNKDLVVSNIAKRGTKIKNLKSFKSLKYYPLSWPWTGVRLGSCFGPSKNFLGLKIESKFLDASWKTTSLKTLPTHGIYYKLSVALKTRTKIVKLLWP